MEKTEVLHYKIDQMEKAEEDTNTELKRNTVITEKISKGVKEINEKYTESRNDLAKIIVVARVYKQDLMKIVERMK
jgi:hypothetical protein